MNKIKSRKLWAFLSWLGIVLFCIFTKHSPPEYLIDAFGKITMLYVLSQGAVDAVGKWKNA